MAKSYKAIAERQDKRLATKTAEIKVLTECNNSQMTQLSNSRDEIATLQTGHEDSLILIENLKGNIRDQRIAFRKAMDIAENLSISHRELVFEKVNQIGHGNVVSQDEYPSSLSPDIGKKHA